MIVVYIAGPFRGANAWEVHQHINAAEALAYDAWAAGFAVICPHNNTRHFDGALTDSVWLIGDLELLRRSDAVLTTPDWRHSSGATREVAQAELWDIPVFERLELLVQAVNKREIAARWPVR